MEYEHCQHRSEAAALVLVNLPEGQAGIGRHKCATCAYQAGQTQREKLHDNEESEVVACSHGNTAPVWVVANLPDSQGGSGRHKCVICSYIAGFKGKTQYVGIDTQPDINLRTPTPAYASGFKLTITAAPQVASMPIDGNHARDFKPRIGEFDAEIDLKNKKLGLAGECLVVAHEKSSLTDMRLLDLAERVVHVSVMRGDGAGYDILSFFKDGKEKYIEVKTTTGVKETPFYITANELAFINANKESCRIYRVYNFDTKENNAEYFVIDLDIFKELPIEPINYVVKFRN